MNQILQYLGIAAIAGLSFTALYTYSTDSLDNKIQSQHDKIEL